jgi:hypothetical protein
MSEQQSLDANHLLQSHANGNWYDPLLVRVAEQGEIPAEEEQELIQAFAQKLFDEEQRLARQAARDAVVQAHYQCWLADSVNVPYRVPTESQQ